MGDPTSPCYRRSSAINGGTRESRRKKIQKKKNDTTGLQHKFVQNRTLPPYARTIRGFKCFILSTHQSHESSIPKTCAHAWRPAGLRRSPRGKSLWPDLAYLAPGTSNPPGKFPTFPGDAAYVERRVHSRPTCSVKASLLRVDSAAVTRARHLSLRREQAKARETRDESRPVATSRIRQWVGDPRNPQPERYGTPNPKVGLRRRLGRLLWEGEGEWEGGRGGEGTHPNLKLRESFPSQL